MVLRYFFISLFLHFIIISFCLVGFTIPGYDKQNMFDYLGVSKAMEYSQNEVEVAKGKVNLNNLDSESSSNNYSAWLKMREVEKPR